MVCVSCLLLVGCSSTGGRGISILCDGQCLFPGCQAALAAFSMGVAALGIAAPSSPGAVGVLELSIVGALSLFGLDPSTALALAISIHIVQYLTTGVLGAYALAQDGESLIGLYRRVRNIKVSNG